MADNSTKRSKRPSAPQKVWHRVPDAVAVRLVSRFGEELRDEHLRRMSQSAEVPKPGAQALGYGIFDVLCLMLMLAARSM